MKILLTSEFFLSGQSTHVLDLAIQLHRLGQQIAIAYTNIHAKEFYTDYGPMLRKNGISYYLASTQAKLAQIVRYYQPQIIHCHSSTIFALCSKLAQIYGTGFVVTCHGLGFSHPKYKQALDMAHRIIAVGPNAAAEIPHAFHDKVVIIPNGIDIERFTPGKKENKLHVYYIGRLDWSKVPALSKLQQVIERIPVLDLTIVSNWHPPLNNVQFLPWETHIEKVMSRANIVAACGRTAREALACGCAVLLMNTSYDGIISPHLVGSPDFDFSGNIGRYSFSTMYHDLYRLVTNQDQLMRLQKFGREYAIQDLSSRKMAENTLAVYNEILETLNQKQLPIINYRAGHQRLNRIRRSTRW